MKVSKLSGYAAIATLALLILLTTVGLVFVVPAISQGLVTEFSEYANDRWAIQGLLSVPVALTAFTFAEIIYLLRLLNTSEILSDSAFKWVKLLAFTTLALAVSILMIFIWLMGKNTLPPAVAIVLIGSFLLAQAVSFVTFSLLGLLKKATRATQDLEGVI